MPNDVEDYRGAAVGGSLFTRRTEDLSEFDLSKEDMTTDGDYHDWDISSIVPVGTKLVLISSRIIDDLIDSFIQLQYPGIRNGKNVSQSFIAEANKNKTADHLVPVDGTDRIVEYFTTNTTWTIIWLAVRGWWV